MGKIKTFFASFLAIVQLLFSVFFFSPAKYDPVDYGGGDYTVPAIVEPYELVSDGESDYVIIVADNASETDLTAADYLQKYIEEISGALLPILTDTETASGAYEICIGSTNRDTAAVEARRSDLIDEGYVKLMDNDKLFISGMGERGNIYGVISFLEDQLGCRFYTPELYVIPENETVIIDRQLNDLQNPAFGYREVLWRVGFKSTEWKLFNKINSSFANPMPANYGGGIWYADFCHSMERLVTVDKYFASNPEYFSWRNDKGARTTDQRCLTNPDVLAITIDSARKAILANPGAQIMSITQNDNSLPCQCAECVAMDAFYDSPAGTNIWFVNQVADALAEEFPDMMFDTLAYVYTRKAPVGIAPADNVIVRLCTIECCFAHPLSECGHERGENIIELAQDIDSTFAKDIEDWSKLTDKLWIWNYTTNYKMNQLPFPNFHTLAGDLHWFLENNVTGVFEQGNNDDFHSGEFGEMRAYLLAKLLWNPYINVEATMIEFMNAYYGEEATPYIKEYLDFITVKTAETAHLFCFCWPEEGPIFTSRETANFSALWEKAEATADNEFQLKNIRRSRLQVRVYMASCLQNEFSLLNPGRIDENKKLIEDIQALDITRMTIDKDLYIPEGLDWLLRPVEWVTPDKILWNK